MFRFTIRDLLWLTVAVALGVAWWVRERQLQAELTRIQAHLNEQTMRAVSKAKTVENLTKMMETMGWTVDLNDGGGGTVTPPGHPAPPRRNAIGGGLP